MGAESWAVMGALVALWALPAVPARACGAFTEGIKRKLADYTAYRQRNEEVLQKDIGTETKCTSDGATISASMAKLADAYSCQAEMDASGMDKKMTEIGTDCEAKFKRIHEFQVDLHARFEKVKTEVEETMEYVDGSHALDESCGSEVAYANKMLQEFYRLEGSIIHVEARAYDGKMSYGKFKDTAAQLKSLTGSLGKGCGGVQEAFATLAKGLSGKGSHDSVPGRHSPGSASDVTGVKKDVRVASGGASTLVERPPGPSGTEAAPARSGSHPESASRVTSSAEAAASFAAAADLGVPGRSGSVAREPASRNASPSSVGASIWNVSETENAGIQFHVDEGAPRAPSPPQAPATSASAPAPAPDTVLGTASVSATGTLVRPIALQAQADIPVPGAEASTPSGSPATSAPADDLFTRVNARYRASDLFRKPKP